MNTHKGLFKYTCLPFGISSAPGNFQRVMEGLLQGIPRVVVYLDDILNAGTTATSVLTVVVGLGLARARARARAGAWAGLVVQVVESC